MFKKPKNHGVNGLALILDAASDSKAERNKATRTLIIALEKRRREQLEITGDEQIATWRKFGLI
jgi:hypothetical protein